MEQLTEQEKTSQRRVYKWCMATFALEAVLVTAIAIASAVFPKHRTLPAIAGCALFGSFVPLLIALNRIKGLTITQRVDVDVRSLPYKLAEEKNLMYLLSGVVVLISVMMVSELLNEDCACRWQNLVLTTNSPEGTRFLTKSKPLSIHLLRFVPTRRRTNLQNEHRWQQVGSIEHRKDIQNECPVHARRKADRLCFRRFAAPRQGKRRHLYYECRWDASARTNPDATKRGGVRCTVEGPQSQVQAMEMGVI